MIKLLNILLFSILTGSLWGQVCDHAVNINSTDRTIDPHPTCISGHTSIFTYIFCDSILQTNGLKINISSIKNGGFGDAFTVRLYGPYTTLMEGCMFVPTSSSTNYNSNANLQGFESVELNPQSWTVNKIYIIKIEFSSCRNGVNINQTVTNPRLSPPSNSGEPCFGCLPKFSPPVGKYIITAWVKEKNPLDSIFITNYANSKIEIYDGITLTDQFYPIGNIIDGWQKIEGLFELSHYTDFKIKLATVGNVTAYFDDIRVQPFNSSMITYVYDPLTLRLAAELDERNYAKIYEYDEEGKLIRIKKETEKGIMTIQETRENSSK